MKRDTATLNKASKGLIKKLTDKLLLKLTESASTDKQLSILPPPREWKDFTASERRMLSDLTKRGNKVSGIVSEMRSKHGGDKPITDEEMKEILQKIAPIRKSFTEYS